jgi:hypothetical protein
MTEQEFQKLLKEKQKTRFAIWTMQEVGKLSFGQWDKAQFVLSHGKPPKKSNGRG